MNDGARSIRVRNSSSAVARSGIAACLTMEGSRHNRQHNATVNGLTLLVMLALGVGIAVAWRAGIAQGRRETAAAGPREAPARRRRMPRRRSRLRPPSARTTRRGEQARIVRSLLRRE